MTATHIPGYTARSSEIARSPVTMAELELMKKTALFSDDDVRMLKLSRGILDGQVEAILDVWYGFVASSRICSPRSRIAGVGRSVSI